MIIYDWKNSEGRHFPARRTTRNIVNGVASPISSEYFSLGYVVLEPNGGQVPWHNHPQEEVYTIISGEAEICVGEDRNILYAGQTVHIPCNKFHQLTNISDQPVEMIYCYAPAGDVAHWKQELEGTLPRAGEGDIPPLPEGAHAQCTHTFEELEVR